MNRILVSRRVIVVGFGALLLTTAKPTPISNTAKIIKICCVCKYNNKQWVVFDDTPTTIFAFGNDFDHEFKIGEEYLVQENV